MPQWEPNPALEGLHALIGEWVMESPQFTGVRGQVTFEWLEGGAFLVERSEPRHALFPTSTAIISRDDSTGTYCMLYYDSRGVSRVYQMSFSGGVWKLWRQAPGFWQRFTASLSEDGNTISGYWEKSVDGSDWEHDFDLKYSRAQ